MGNELQKELEKMNNEIAKHEDYLKSEKTTYGLADLINGKIPSKQLPSEVNLTANTLEEMNALVTQGSVNDGQLCYCKADKKLYVLKDNVWSEVGGGGGGKSVPPTLNFINWENGEIRTSITEEEKTNLDNGLYNQVVYMQNENDLLGYQLPTKLFVDTSNEVYSFATFSSDSISAKLTGISLIAINIGEKDETTNTYPITFEDNVQIALPGADTRTVVLFNRPNQILAPNDGGADIILPCTASDNGKVLSVVDGEAQWAKIDANSYPYITGRINASDTQTSSFPETDSETRVVTIENLDLSKLHSARTIIVDAYADASEVFNIACGAYGETEGIGTYVSSISCDKKTNNLFFFYINMDTQTSSFIIKRKTIPTSTNDLYIHNIVLKDTANTPTKKIYLTIQSTANTPATTKELIQTLLGSTARYIRVSGYTPTNDISAINWTGTFDTSKYDVRGTETLLTDFTVIEDSVVTL